jgi:DNA polymerase-3 subunit delta
MEDYAANPSEGSTLLLRASSWRPGRIDRIIEKSGAFVPCKALSDAQATTWCATRGQDRYQVRVEPDAAELLVGLCGPDLCRLDAELGKLAAYVGDPGRVSRQDVATLVGRSREEKAWALQSAVLSGRPAVALTRLRELLEISRVPQELAMWAIGDLLRRLHAAAHMLRQGAVRSEVRSRLRLFGPDGDRIIELARRAGPARLARLLDRAVESDLATRTGLGEASRNLEVLSVEVSDTIGCV